MSAAARSRHRRSDARARLGAHRSDRSEHRRARARDLRPTLVSAPDLQRGAASLIDRGRFVVFAEIASVPAVLAISASTMLLALRAAGADAEAEDAIVPWLLASMYVVAGRAAFAWAAASAPIASVTEVVDLLIKRVVDLAVAVVLLVLLLPLAIVLSVSNPARGRWPNPLPMSPNWAARSRVRHVEVPQDAERCCRAAAHTRADDDRFTRVGRFLARSKLDETPTALERASADEMSLVGPRPEDPEFVALHPTAYETIGTDPAGRHRALPARVRQGVADHR